MVTYSPPLIDIDGGEFFIRTVKKKIVYIIQGKDAEDFERRINEKLQGLEEPKITFVQTVPFIAYIEAEQVETRPDSLADKHYLQGDRFVCGQCPYMKQSTDMRRRWHACLFSDTVTRADSPVCEDFYIMLDNGVIDRGKIRERGRQNGIK